MTTCSTPYNYCVQLTAGAHADESPMFGNARRS